MKKNDVFTFTAPNGVEVTGVIIDIIHKKIDDSNWNKHIWEYLCYAQNRLILMHNTVRTHTKREWYGCCAISESTIKDDTPMELDKILADYAILPDYDEMLEVEQQKFNNDCYEALSSIGDMDF